MKHLFISGLLLLVAVSCGADATKGPGDNGGNTNWLRTCATDADCKSDGQCVSKRCLMPCEAASGCEGFSNTECSMIRDVSFDDEGDCSKGPAESLCALLCDRDGDCADLGAAYRCDESVCTPTCEGSSPSPSSPARPSEPTPNEPASADAGPVPGFTDGGSPEPNVDECVVVMNVSECCPQAFGARRSELEQSDCWYEIIDGDYQQPSGLPQHCYPSCPELLCAPFETPGVFGMAVADALGNCMLEPTCEDGSCPGSLCDPVVGCSAEWTDPVTDQGRLQCKADTCGEVGVCTYAEYGSCGEFYAPVCACDGNTYDNRCTAGPLAPIQYEGECKTTDPAPVTDGDACVIAFNAADCCPEPYATRRSDVDSDDCVFEVIDGDTSPVNDVPDVCFGPCPAIACPRSDELSLFGMVTERDGNCVLEATCDDGSCVGSTCDPNVGCDSDWECSGPSCQDGDRLSCFADACGAPGTCLREQPPQCPPESEPVCGCDGTQYDSTCSAGLNPIDHVGECSEAPTP